MEMTPERWRATGAYVREVFGQEDAHLRRLVQGAAERGFPDIAVTSEVGRLLSLLVTLSGAERAIEVGTLAGYSALWISRALPENGRLWTIEVDEERAAFAEEHLNAAGLGSRVEVVRGAALDVLPRLASQLAPESIGLCFLDAVKSEYLDYLALLRPLLKPGGLLVADNVLGSSQWWIDQPGVGDRDAVDRFNRTVAADPGFDAVALPVREGVLIARKRIAEEARKPGIGSQEVVWGWSDQ